MITILDVPRKTYEGVGSIEKLSESISSLAIQHAFVVLSERSKNEHGTQLTEIAKANGCRLTFSLPLLGEPTFADVRKNVMRLHECQADGIIGLGGGSALDAAKAIAVFARNEQMTLHDMMTINHVDMDRLPLIAIPTTAGSGSEATKIFVITEDKEQVKYNPQHPAFIPDIAILDAQLTTTLPWDMTVTTMIDAFTHALEAYVSTKATRMTDDYALRALNLYAEIFPNIQQENISIDERRHLLLASYYAGIAFSNASTNLAHACGRALGATFQLPHGLSIALTLPFIIQFSYESAREKYRIVEDLFHTKQLATYIDRLLDAWDIYDLAAASIQPENIIEKTDMLVERTLAGNGIETNRNIPTASDIQRIFEQISKKLMEG